nr:MAG TPA: hypothetical protein [Caudoviricetes sp.]
MSLIFRLALIYLTLFYLSFFILFSKDFARLSL